MSLLAQVRSDLQVVGKLALYYALESLVCHDRDEDSAIYDLAKRNEAEMTRLNAILNSGVVPSSYTSAVTGKKYYPSPLELKEVKELPVAKHSFFSAKLSRKLHAMPRSRIALYDPEAKKLLDIYVEHNEDHSYPRGSFAAKVKKVFLTPEEKEPKYALKIFKKNAFDGDTRHEFRIAMRSALCNRLLRRTGYAFRRNEKQYILTDWLEGTPLDEVDRTKIIGIPIQKRIHLALMLLDEIALLHEHDIVHCDIKPGNVMLSENGLHIYDFDSARLGDEWIAGTMLGPIYTPGFLSASSYWLTQKKRSSVYKLLDKNSDIYSSGLTLAFLFPDVLLPTYAKQEITVQNPPEKFDFETVVIKFGKKLVENVELGRFIVDMANNDVKERTPSINEARSRLTKILASYGGKLEAKEMPSSVKNTLFKGNGADFFDEIERELVAYNSRCEHFAKKFSA